MKVDWRHISSFSSYLVKILERTREVSRKSTKDEEEKLMRMSRKRSSRRKNESDTRMIGGFGRTFIYFLPFLFNDALWCRWSHLPCTPSPLSLKSSSLIPLVYDVYAWILINSVSFEMENYSSVKMTCFTAGCILSHEQAKVNVQRVNHVREGKCKSFLMNFSLPALPLNEY